MTAPVALIVEDEPLIALDVVDAVTGAGYAARGPYASAADALEAATSDPPDIAVVDMMLRDDSALSLADYLTSRNIPYVIVSGLAQPQDGHYGGAVWLSKPFEAATLLRALDRALEQSRPAGARQAGTVAHGAPG